MHIAHVTAVAAYHVHAESSPPLKTIYFSIELPLLWLWILR